MLDFTWKVFSQTGNIETYLLLKELELTDQEGTQQRDHNEDYAELDPQL